MKKTIAALLVTLLAACTPPAEEEDPGAVLEPQIGEIRFAAGNGDRAGAVRELAELRTMVGELRRSGDLTDGKAQEILDAAEEVARYLSLVRAPRPTPLRPSPSRSPSPRPTTPPSTPSPTPTEEPEPPPTQEPQPTQAPQTPDDDEGQGNQGQGNQGQDGLSGILRGPD